VTVTQIIVTTTLSYLLGSIPFGYLLVRVFRGKDIRQSGSGNIGATNVSRISPLLGVITLLLDALKGAGAVVLVRAIFPGDARLLGVAAFSAVAGHVFPLWLRFKGGKGVATGMGAFLMIVPKAVLFAAAIFVAVFLLFRYVSLASIVAVGMLPLLAWMLGGSAYLTLLLIAAAAVLVIVKHDDNVRRLIARAENRFVWGQR
jgi:glycerol-3-phosphate acyltransferase PlsY